MLKSKVKNYAFETLTFFYLKINNILQEHFVRCCWAWLLLTLGEIIATKRMAVRYFLFISVTIKIFFRENQILIGWTADSISNVTWLQHLLSYVFVIGNNKWSISCLSEHEISWVCVTRRANRNINYSTLPDRACRLTPFPTHGTFLQVRYLSDLLHLHLICFSYVLHCGVQILSSLFKEGGE